MRKPPLSANALGTTNAGTATAACRRSCLLLTPHPSSMEELKEQRQI